VSAAPCPICGSTYAATCTHTARPDLAGKATRFASWCQHCVLTAHPEMLTGYVLVGGECDRCGRAADLAMVMLRNSIKAEGMLP
jgi:hypothetical protein